MDNHAEKVVRLSDLKKLSQRIDTKYATGEAVNDLAGRLEHTITTDNMLSVTEILKIMEEN